MENVKKLLDEAKAKTGKVTDYALAKTLELPKQRISDYYKEKTYPDDFACMKIANATGRSLEQVIALVRIDAEKDEKRRNAWRNYLKRLGGMAASVALPFYAVVFFELTPTPATAAPALNNAIGMICIMLNIGYIIKRQSELRRIGFISCFGVFIREIRKVPAY